MSPNYVINLGDVLKHQVAKADKFYVATALMSSHGFEVLRKASGSCEVKLVVGIDLSTPVDVFEELLQMDYDFRVFREENKVYHPKVYMLQIDDKWQAFIGSGNFTKGGLASNLEMTVGIADDEIIGQLLEWFDKVYEKGIVIDESWLKEYRDLMDQTITLNNERRKLLNDFKAKEQILSDPLTKYDFRNQFFKYEHHNAFSGDKPRERKDPEVIEERMGVKRRLLDLHDLIWPTIRKTNWNLNHHYDSSHIVSSHAHSEGTADELRALWLSYNRPKKEFQKLDSASTPLLQMRLQVLVRYTNVAIHLTIGKNGGGYYERMTIREKLRRRDDDFLSRFSALLTNLPESYYIDIAGVNRNVHSFEDESELRDFLLTDDQINHYFIIGRQYQPDSQEVGNESIVQTVIAEFERLMPIYNLLTVPV